MKITALLSWYAEDPAWLTRCVTSLNLIPVDHVIALDGAYSYFPDAQPSSDPIQATAICEAAKSIGIGYTVMIPGEPWAGEVEKRNRMFAAAERTSGPDDWYLVIDADEHVQAAPPDVHEQLAATVFDVAAVTLLEPGHPMGTVIYPTHPKFFRAIPGLRAVGDHFTYITPDGRKLWGNAKTTRLEARHDLTAVVVEHHREFRDEDRREAAKACYRKRDELGIEGLPADRTILA